MTTTIPPEIISNIVGYISNVLGYDYKYNRYRKHWCFSYNKYNKKAVVLNDMLTYVWSVRRFYDMSLPENKILEKNPKFQYCSFTAHNGFPMGILYYTEIISKPSKEQIYRLRVNAYTDLEGNTCIGIYKNSPFVEDLFHKLIIKDKNKFEYS